MLSEKDLNGSLLPPKTLCLTFDDGPGETSNSSPGPKTLRIAEYLNENGISATFFMVGKHILQYPHVLPEVSKLGHIIGNHGFCHHRSFPELLENQWDYFSEILWTDELIRSYNASNDIYFRAPWGAFSPELAIQFNTTIQNNLNHVGPFVWDIAGVDWYCWEKGISIEECVECYWEEIQAKDHGIVLMHDSTADLLNAKRNNSTFETLQILIPRLKDAGYNFVNLDKVPIDN